MHNASDFFAEFPPVSKADWLARIAKDLKDKSIDDLTWAPEPGLSVDPFGHIDDFPAAVTALAQPAGWEIMEAFHLTDPVAANAEILTALEGGAEGVRLHLSSLSSEALAQTLEGVHPDYISWYFSADNWSAVPPAGLLHSLGSLARTRGLAPASLRGALAYDPMFQSTLQDWRYVQEMLAMVKTDMPGFRVLSVSADPPDHDTPGELAHLLHRGNQYLKALTERGLAAADVAAQLHFDWVTDKSYFLEIAKMRAFKLLWLNVLQAWGAPLSYPVLQVRFRPEAYSDDLYTNMIRATTMAMSAVMGGATSLTVLPYDAGRETQAAYPKAFARRIARNVQHLLKMESALDTVADPAAGSYYIEKLTNQLAVAAWQRFQQL